MHSSPGQERFQLETETPEPGQRTLRLRGAFDSTNAPQLWRRLQHETAALERGSHCDFDVSAVDHIDGAAVALLVHQRAQLHQQGVTAELVGASAELQEVIHLYSGDVRVRARKRRRPRGTLDQIGKAAMEIVREAQLGLGFVGQMLIAAGRGLRAPRSVNWHEVLPTAERAGADAIPIILLINFLVGLVMAFQSSDQLKRFGANIFLADLIGIAMTRELGPLMTAIVVTGRTGAAFAAELGTMRVNEEIDALRTMGLGPMSFLVLPRVLALMIAVPILTLFSDAVGTLGGLVAGVVRLDLTPSAYFNETQKAVKLWDVSSGMIKSAVFGLAIVLVCCQQGLAAHGGADAVGRRTTSAVVTSLFMLIIIDAILTVAFRVSEL